MSFKAGMKAGSGAVQKPAARVEPAPAPIVKYCESCGTRPATKGEYCLPCHKQLYPEQHESKPKVEKEPALSDAAKKAACKTFISAYRKTHLDAANIGAPWWDIFDEWVEYARKKGWPVDEWLVAPKDRKAKESKQT